MLITRRLRLLSPILAAKPSNDPTSPRRVFVKEGTPKGEDESRVFIRSDMERWNWAFRVARESLTLEDLALSTIVPYRWYSVKRTSTYNRRYKHKGRMCMEQFESVQSGQVLEVKFTLARHIPPLADYDPGDQRPPEVEEFDAMLEHIGTALGMSEWGHGRDYGMFEIQQIPKPPNDRIKPTDPDATTGPDGEGDILD